MEEALKRSAVEFLKDQRDLISFANISFNEDGIACIPEPPLKSNQQFSIAGKRFYVQIISDGKKGHCEIWGNLGRLPYSAENPKQRKVLLHILRRTREQKEVQFLVTQNQDVIVAFKTAMDGSIAPISLLSTIYGFLYKAVPFILLISGYTSSPDKKQNK